MTEDRGAGGTAPAGLSEFIKRFRVGWGDLDAHVHLSNVAILNHAADVRFQFFTECGFGGARFAQEHLGPVVTRDTLSYRKELRMMEEYTVELRRGGVSPDGVRWAVENTLRNLAGEVTATVATEGVWFDLEARCPRPPPPEFDAIERRMPRSLTFRELPNLG